MSTAGHIPGAGTEESIVSSPSAAVQGAELHSVLSPSTTCSLVMGTVASGQSSAQSSAGRSRQEMAFRHWWARADAPHRGEMVGWALGLEWISTKAANSARGPSSDDSALHAVFRLAS